MARTNRDPQVLPFSPANAIDPESARQLSPTEQEWKQRIYDRLLKVLDLSLLGSLAEEEARTQIREITHRLLLEDSAPLSLAQRQFVIRRIEDEVMGLGPLEPLLADPTISDILVNGHDQVYVERRGKLELTDVRFNDDAHLMNIIDRIVSAVGRRVDESSPMVDARLKDGSRVNAIIPPLALDGPDAVDPPFRGRAADRRRPDPSRHAQRADARKCCTASCTARLNVLDLRRHGLGQDHAAEHPVGLHPGQRAHRHDRGLGGTAAAAAARGAAGDPAAEHRGQGRGHRSATWCATPAHAARTASSSARCAAPRRWTCCRP